MEKLSHLWDNLVKTNHLEHHDKVNWIVMCESNSMQNRRRCSSLQSGGRWCRSELDAGGWFCFIHLNEPCGKAGGVSDAAESCGRRTEPGPFLQDLQPCPFNRLIWYKQDQRRGFWTMQCSIVYGGLVVLQHPHTKMRWVLPQGLNLIAPTGCEKAPGLRSAPCCWLQREGEGGTGSFFSFIFYFYCSL